MVTLQGEDQLEIFKLDKNGKQIIPPGHQELVASDITRKQDIPAIQRNIAKLKQFLMLNQHNVMWWTAFLHPQINALQVVSVTAI